MLFGQRFVIDSYVSSRVVFDKIIYENEFICRLFPSTIDILFALGNDAAAQLLSDELEAYKYATNLSALRYLIDSYDEAFWSGSVYTMWLNAIRALNPPADRTVLPPFMQTAAWWQQKMNTQLASWSELRHDNLLYAKPSYTSGIGCSYPHGYVEPVPEFYRRMNMLARKAHEKFDGLSFSNDYLRASVLTYFDILQGVTDTLQSIAEKEIVGEAPSDEEISFIQQMIYQEGSYGGGDVTGWYVKLLYGNIPGVLATDIAPDKSEGIVADYHTTPTDCNGFMMGWVSHSGTGPVDLAIITTQMPNGDWMAYAGPVNSYYEYRTTNFLRLTDSEWNDTYQNTSSRPEWVNIYLADKDGRIREAGISLITAVEDPSGESPQMPRTPLMIRNYPNPFNPETIINFVIPSHLTNSHTELTIYNIEGKIIRTLLSERLPAGNYLTKWDGRNESGARVSSGVYFYSLIIESQRVSGKMHLIR
jgi:hypothetical protein